MKFYGFFFTCVMARGRGGFDFDDDPLGSLGTPLVALYRFKRC